MALQWCNCTCVMKCDEELRISSPSDLSSFTFHHTSTIILSFTFLIIKFSLFVSVDRLLYQKLSQHGDHFVVDPWGVGLESPYLVFPLFYHSYFLLSSFHFLHQLIVFSIKKFRSTVTILLWALGEWGWKYPLLFPFILSFIFLIIKFSLFASVDLLLYQKLSQHGDHFVVGPWGVGLELPSLVFPLFYHLYFSLSSFHFLYELIFFSIKN